MAYVIDLPAKWIDGATLDAALKVQSGPHLSLESSIIVSIPSGASVLVDAGLRLLSLSNQLQHVGKRVTLQFGPQDKSKSFNYLDRIGFFRELDKQIIVKPERPLHSRAKRHEGKNQGLVEIQRLVSGSIDGGIPGRLKEAVRRSITAPRRKELAGNTVFTLFSELIDNVDLHAKSELAGYAVLQVYKNGNGVRIAVSDSGYGLLERLQQSVATHYPKLAGLSSRDLMMYALHNGGVSSKGEGQGGAGLKVCADRAQALQADLEIRTPNHSLMVRGKNVASRQNNATAIDNLPLIWGTHVAFDIKLD